MTLILILLTFLAVLELSLWFPACWPARKTFGGLLAYVNLPLSIALVAIHPRIWTVLILYAALYRFVNLLRIRADRIHEDYLYHTSRRTSLTLIGSQLAIGLLAYAHFLSDIRLISFVYLCGSALLGVALLFLLYLERQLRASTVHDVQDPIHPNDLPSLSVLIPARNETEELEACLSSLIASTYKKLEIIVLDDCSQNKRTPEIIKGFAHDGVLFIAGDTPPEHWLAKNYAYQRLANESNGELLMYCGVDARFKPESLTEMVQTMLDKQKTMLSVVPRNVLPRQDSVFSWLVQTGRYSWEFLLPRRFFGRPPVLSTTWLITRDALKTAGGFAAFKQSVSPERHLARRVADQGDGYSFVRASMDMGVTSRKSYEEQLATAVRTRYPLLHKRPESVALYSLLATLVFVWPFLALLVGIVHQDTALVILAALQSLVAAVIGFQMTTLTYRMQMLRGVAAMPLVVLYDVAVLNYSMWQYEFHEVLWKGRNICLPVMHVIPHLPRLED